MKLFPLLLSLAAPLIAVASSTNDLIANGVPRYDDRGLPVNAHGAGVIADGGRFYMFGECKTDTTNAFTGFSCYSSPDLADWTFEGIALGVQPDGLLGPDRVGERPKVMRCPATGEYVMFMHADNLGYKDQYTCYATSPTVTGPYTFRGPVMLDSVPLRHWDMGTFQDTDGTGYILAHHGPVYRLSPDFHSAEAMVSNVKGSGESPAVVHCGDNYFHLSSNLTSWERNDNFYYTAPSMEGPWTRRGLFCPEGTLTWNSQTSFVLPVEIEGRTVPVYMGDRWSFPRQGSAATYVWLPLEVSDSAISIPSYMPFWSIADGREHSPLSSMPGSALGSAEGPLFSSNNPADTLVYTFEGSQVALTGLTGQHGGYALLTLSDAATAETVFTQLIDFYSLRPDSGVRFLSPQLPQGRYTLTLTVTGDFPKWTNKRGDRFGSDDSRVIVSDIRFR